MRRLVVVPTDEGADAAQLSTGFWDPDHPVGHTGDNEPITVGSS